MPDWVVCPRCHFRQVPAERCRRCGEALGAVSPDAVAEADAARALRTRHRKRLAAVAVAAVLIVVTWATFGNRSPETAGPPVTPIPTAGALDLSGRWHAQFSKMIGKTPPRPVLKEIAIESGRDGGILAASVVFTDPGGAEPAPGTGPPRTGRAASRRPPPPWQPARKAPPWRWSS